MIFHPDGSRLPSHFIKPEYLAIMLRRGAFCLTRQDPQSDKDDGVLPAACFKRPYHGQLEQALHLSPEFLSSQAHAVAALRNRTFIMCWTCDPVGHMRQKYGENGLRCELQASEQAIKRMLGYEWLAGCEFPPKRRSLPEIPGGGATAELKEPSYTDGTQAISVMPSAFATAHKHEYYAVEAELRVEAIIAPREVPVGENDHKIAWGVTSFDSMAIVIGSKIVEPAAA